MTANRANRCGSIRAGGTNRTESGKSFLLVYDPIQKNNLYSSDTERVDELATFIEGYVKTGGPWQKNDVETIRDKQTRK